MLKVAEGRHVMASVPDPTYRESAEQLHDLDAVEREALERYYERRIREIRRDEGRSVSFMSVAELRRRAHERQGVDP